MLLGDLKSDDRSSEKHLKLFRNEPDFFCLWLVANPFSASTFYSFIQQALDGYFNSVCELDLVFSLHKSLMSEFFGVPMIHGSLSLIILFK